MAAWATVADVLDVTGVTVTPEQVGRANYEIENLVGRVAVDGGPSATTPPTKPSDAEWLRRAVAFQAAWLVAQPDDLVRMDITSTGTSASAVELTDTAMVLAPHAKQALRRLSWLRSRTIPVRSYQTSDECVDADGFRGGKWVPF